jgi:hypothetical protein
MRSAQPLSLALACIALALPGHRDIAVAGETNAAHPHEQGHPQQGSGSAALVSRLEMRADGPRWPTDAPLRTGMTNIRAAFDADHPAIHAGRQTDAQYDALAGTIEREVNTIVANCKLAPDADAQLHYVVGDLLQAVSLLRGSDPSKSRHDGAHLVHGALKAYGKYFDDPTWAKASSGHDPHEQGHGHDH